MIRETDDEILEKARLIEKHRAKKAYQDRLERGRNYAERIKEFPLTVTGLVNRTFEYSGPTGEHEVEKVTEVFSRLPENTKVEVIIKVLEVGDGHNSWDDTEA
jgi:hypothetical protein